MKKGKNMEYKEGEEQSGIELEEGTAFDTQPPTGGEPSVKNTEIVPDEPTKGGVSDKTIKVKKSKKYDEEQEGIELGGESTDFQSIKNTTTKELKLMISHFQGIIDDYKKASIQAKSGIGGETRANIEAKGRNFITSISSIFSDEKKSDKKKVHGATGYKYVEDIGINLQIGLSNRDQKLKDNPREFIQFVIGTLNKDFEGWNQSVYEYLYQQFGVTDNQRNNLARKIKTERESQIAEYGKEKMSRTDAIEEANLRIFNLINIEFKKGDSLDTVKTRVVARMNALAGNPKDLLLIDNPVKGPSKQR